MSEQHREQLIYKKSKYLLENSIYLFFNFCVLERFTDYVIYRLHTPIKIILKSKKIESIFIRIEKYKKVAGDDKRS